MSVKVAFQPLKQKVSNTSIWSRETRC